MEIFDKNNLAFGLLIGLITPIIGFGLVYVIFELMVSAGLMDAAGSASGKRFRTMLIMAICCNAIVVKKYNQPFTTQTLRGIVSATMLLCAIWFFKYYDTLYSE